MNDTGLLRGPGIRLADGIVTYGGDVLQVGNAVYGGCGGILRHS
jgi:hypothetical protein